MPDHADALTALVEYLDEHAAEFRDDFTRKFRSRAKVIDDPARPETLVFEIERHRGILGTCYKPGVPMSSFITYWPRYAFHLVVKKLEPVGLIRPSQWTFGASADAEVGGLAFRFSKAPTGGVRVTEKASGNFALVTNRDEAESFAAGLVGRWNLDRYALEAGDALAPAQRQEYLRAVRQELENAARRRLTDYWNLLFKTS